MRKLTTGQMRALLRAAERNVRQNIEEDIPPSPSLLKGMEKLQEQLNTLQAVNHERSNAT